MIHGIGTDIVKVARMEAGYARYGERFARRLLSDDEFAEFRRCAYHPARFLAKRFAAKEAVAKALGTGFTGGLRLTDITVTHDAKGRPGLAYAGRAAQMLRECGVGQSHLSISDEWDYAIAFVVLTATAPPITGS